MLGKAAAYKKFLSFCNKLIGYFYNNISCPSYVCRESYPSFYNLKIKDVINNKDKTYSSNRDDSNVEYVATNGTLKINFKKKGKFCGDLEADEKNSFYLGRHIIRSGDRPQSYSRSPDPMIEFYEQNKSLFKEFNVDVDKAVVINGCFKTNKITLQRTMIPETNSEFAGLPSMKLIKKKEVAIKSVIRKLKIPQLPKASVEDISNCTFNLKTFPGFHYKEYFNCDTKEKALDIAHEVAKRRWENIEKANEQQRNVRRNEIFPNTFVVGARNKRDYFYEDGEAITSRAVHMPEFHSEMNSATWIDPITEYIKMKKKGCIYIGNSYKDYNRLYEDMFGSDCVIEGDVKRFDSSLYITDIIIATAICRLYYDINDDSIDNHFLAMFDTIGIKDYITPGGHMYRLMHGLPSGVKSTSILGSLINGINLLHCCRHISSKRVNLIVGGDDFLIPVFTKIDDSFIDKMNSEADEIGIKFKILKRKFLDAKEIEDKPCFYKYTVDGGEPVVPTSTILERVFIPWNKKYRNDYEILKFLFDVIPSLASPRSSVMLFYLFFSKMYLRVTGREYSISSIVNLHRGIYNGVMSGAISLSKDDDVNYSIGFLFDKTKPLPSNEINNVFKTEYSIKERLLPAFVKDRKKF